MTNRRRKDQSGQALVLGIGIIFLILFCTGMLVAESIYLSQKQQLNAVTEKAALAASYSLDEDKFRQANTIVLNCDAPSGRAYVAANTIVSQTWANATITSIACAPDGTVTLTVTRPITQPFYGPITP